MNLIIKLLNDMAARHPQEIALTEDGNTISFAGLKQLVHTLSQQLCDNDAGIYGQYIQNMTSSRIFALCAERVGIFSKLVNIPPVITKENLSSTLKKTQIQVLYTDLLDKILETTNGFGPYISLVTPIEMYHHKIWKVRFCSDCPGARGELEKVNSRHRQWRLSRRKNGVCV